MKVGPTKPAKTTRWALCILICSSPLARAQGPIDDQIQALSAASLRNSDYMKGYPSVNNDPNVVRRKFLGLNPIDDANQSLPFYRHC